MLKITCKNLIYVNGVIAPCGKCFSCRSKYRRQWQLRLQHELLSYNGNAMFLTLTYNEENYPENHSLSKRDVQLFIKRLRKYYSDIQIRYFAVGEYGDKKMRPHYHLIIYGLRAPESKKKSILNWKYGKFIAEHIWKKGYCFVGYVNSQCIAYVSKYVLKSFVKDIPFEAFEKSGMLPPFSLKSTGIGLRWLIEHTDKVVTDLINNRTVKLFKSSTSYPRYYRKKLIEFGYFEEDYFSKKYYEEMDNIQSTIISELSDVHIHLSNRNYLNMSISDLYNCHTYRKNVSFTRRITIPGKYGLFHVTDHKEEPLYTQSELDDIYKNHWFIVYTNYCKSCSDIHLKNFKNKNKDWFSDYE